MLSKFFIPTPYGVSKHFVPNNWQLNMIKSYFNNNCIEINKPRQIGASTLIAILALCECVINKHNVCICVPNRSMLSLSND